MVDNMGPCVRLLAAVESQQIHYPWDIVSQLSQSVIQVLGIEIFHNSRYTDNTFSHPMKCSSETFEKCSFLLKLKEGENFNHEFARFKKSIIHGAI